ncbi:unnamed protein product [Schistosoma curassoni]|uniref:Integrase n=1 Tax=Schistosoma curassoni TaxID=6186 RepID=A0A183K0J1_9TREM|nr:unnamed protein product [Schistosoma curassoni]
MREIHCTHAGQKRIDLEEMLLYSGHKEETASHTQEFALMCQEKHGQNLLDENWVDPESSKHPSKRK